MHKQQDLVLLNARIRPNIVLHSGLRYQAAIFARKSEMDLFRNFVAPDYCTVKAGRLQDFYDSIHVNQYILPVILIA